MYIYGAIHACTFVLSLFAYMHAHVAINEMLHPECSYAQAYTIQAHTHVLPMSAYANLRPRGKMDMDMDMDKDMDMDMHDLSLSFI
jgi:hypothetical protein